MNIKDFFQRLNEEILNAKTKRTLRILTKRAKREVEAINLNPYISRSVKALSKREMNKSIRLIKSQMKKVI